MKLIANVEKKTLRILENERSIFRGEYGADKLELYINKQLINEYPTITALLSNGRKIGPYSSDSGFGSETIDGVNYNMAKNTCDIVTAINASNQRVIDYMTSEKIDTLNRKLAVAEGQISNYAQTNAIISALKPCPSPAYVVPNPNCCYPTGCTNVQ
mgnify:CR=1 FL=1